MATVMADSAHEMACLSLAGCIMAGWRLQRRQRADWWKREDRTPC